MNKFMYLGLLLGLIISVVLNKLYIYDNPSMVAMICTVIGTFAGAALDNEQKSKKNKKWGAYEY